MIRPVDTDQDAVRCADIFAPYAEGPSAFVDVAPSADEMRNTIARTRITHPWLVADERGVVVGYAYAGQHRARPGYRWSTEVSGYVDPAWHGRGVGRALYAALLDQLRRQGFHAAYAGVALPNPASVAFHEALGFTLVGVFHEVGWTAGAWRDVGWWELILDGADVRTSTAPPEPRPTFESAEAQ
jgi:L-amino acid N-acyltransferase YncA